MAGTDGQGALVHPVRSPAARAAPNVIMRSQSHIARRAHALRHLRPHQRRLVLKQHRTTLSPRWRASIRSLGPRIHNGTA